MRGTFLDRAPARRWVALTLLAGVLSFAPGVAATVCESYTDEASCNNLITSSGRCLWQNGECTTQLGSLPPGVVAITGTLEPGTPSESSSSGTGVGSPAPPPAHPRRPLTPPTGRRRRELS